MRYFDELKNYIGQSFDEETQIIKETDINNYTYSYQVTKKRITHEEHNEIPYTDEDGPGDRVDWPNGDVSYRGHEVVDQEEEGQWVYNSQSGYPETDVEIHPFEDSAHNETISVTEKVTIVRDLTKEELEERAKAKEDYEKSMAEAQIQRATRETFISNLMNNNALTALLTQDQATTETYETLTESANVTFKNTEPFSQAYARRIKRSELVVADCPPELKDRIAEIIDASTLCDFSAKIVHGQFAVTKEWATEIKQSLDREQTVSLMILADQGCRVPTQDEIDQHLKFIAKDDNGKTIDDYFKLYCSYNTTNSSTTAVLTIAVNERAAKINLTIDCLSDN